MAKKKSNRALIKLKSTMSPEVYWTMKNKTNTIDRLSLKKFDKKIRKHVLFKEAK